MRSRFVVRQRQKGTLSGAEFTITSLEQNTTIACALFAILKLLGNLATTRQGRSGCSSVRLESKCHSCPGFVFNGATLKQTLHILRLEDTKPSSWTLHKEASWRV